MEIPGNHYRILKTLWLLALVAAPISCSRSGYSDFVPQTDGGGDSIGNGDTDETSCVSADCPLGCNGGEDRCNILIPSNVYDPLLILAGSADSMISVAPSDILDINTDTGSIQSTQLGVIRRAGSGLLDGIHFAILAQASGPALGTLSMAGFEIQEGASVRVTGSYALVILAQNDVLISGLLDASAGAAPISGAGGYAGGARRQAGNGPGAGGISNNHSGWDHGGGGAGHGDTGGAGGLDLRGASDIPAEGGIAYGSSNLIPLEGGSGGAGGGHNGPGQGGGGGGAVQISAIGRIDVTSAGLINVNGSGGGASSTCGGAGGGAGGAVLLEAMEISVAGTIVANGGGGSDWEGGPAGTDGLLSDQRAAGGGGTGGAGGAGSALTGLGGTDNSGAGGGSAGRIRINTLNGTPDYGSNAIISPSILSAAYSSASIISE